MPCVSSLFIPEPPSAVVGLLITIRSSGEANYGDLWGVAICVAIRTFAYSLARLDHVGQGSDMGLAKNVGKAELSSKVVPAGLRLLRSRSGPRCRVCGEARGPLQVHTMIIRDNSSVVACAPAPARSHQFLILSSTLML